MIPAEGHHVVFVLSRPIRQALLHKVGGNHIQPPFRHGLVDLVGGHVIHIELDLPVQPLEMGNMPVHMDVPQGTEDSHIELHRPFLCSRTDVLYDFPQFLHPCPDTGQEPLPFFGEMASSPGSFNQLHPQSAFQPFDLGTEGGLGNIRFPGSPGKIPHPAIYDKALHLCNGGQIFRHNFSPFPARMMK